MIQIKKLFRSFHFATRGFFSIVRTEQNFRLHILASIIVIFFSFFFNIKIWQWCLIVLMIAFVFILEMMNTVFERLVDMLKPRLHYYVQEIKDIMSAMVLVAAVASIIIAIIIFAPYLWALFQ